MIERLPDIPVPLSALVDFFDRLRGLAFRAGDRIYTLEYSFRDRDQVLVSHDRLAEYLGCYRPNLSRAMVGCCCDRSKDGVPITPLIVKTRPDDKGCCSYHIPAGSLTRSVATANDESNIFGIRHFIFNEFQDTDGNIVNFLHCKKGLSDAALHLLLRIEILRDRGIDDWYRLDSFLRSPGNMTIELAKGLVVTRPPITRYETLRNAARELAAIRSPYTNNPILEIDPNRKTLHIRSGHRNDTADTHDGYQTHTGMIRPIHTDDTAIGTQEGNVQHTELIHQGHAVDTTNTRQGNHQDTAMRPMTSVVVVIDTTTTGVVHELPASGEFVLKFSNGDREDGNADLAVKAHIEQQIAAGEKPKGKDGTWNGLISHLKTKARQGVGIHIPRQDGFDISSYVTRRVYEHDRLICRPMTDKVREIVDRGRCALLTHPGDEPWCVLRMRKDGVWIKEGDHADPDEHGIYLEWREFFHRLSSRSWTIDALVAAASARPGSEDGKPESEMDQAMRKIREALDNGQEIRLESAGKKTLFIYGYDEGLYQARMDDGAKEMVEGQICFMITMEGYRLVDDGAEQAV